MKKESVIAGIAIGDADTYISIMQDGSVKNIPGLLDAEATPSVTAIRENRALRFGYEAFGCPQEGTVRLSLHKLLREGYVVVDGRFPWSAEEVLAQFLRQQRMALRWSVGNVDSAIFSVPWDFDYSRIQILENAAGRAGLEALRFLNETSLIALACCDKMLTDDRSHGFFVCNVKSDCMEAGYYEAEAGVLENHGVAGTHFQKRIPDTASPAAELKQVFDLLREMGAFAYTAGEHPVIYNKYKNLDGTEDTIYAEHLFLTGEVRSRSALWEELGRLTGLEAQYVPFQFAARGAALQGAKLRGAQAVKDLLFLDATACSYWLQVGDRPAECVIKQAVTIPVKRSIAVKMQDEGNAGTSLQVHIFQALGSSLNEQTAVKTYDVPAENPGAFSNGTLWSFGIDIDAGGRFTLIVTDDEGKKVFCG